MIMSDVNCKNTFTYNSGSFSVTDFFVFEIVKAAFSKCGTRVKVTKDAIQEKSNREKHGEDQSEWLTRSQSTFRKNGWPMMSAKPVWGWQPRRSFGSCGSESEGRVRDISRKTVEETDRKSADGQEGDEGEKLQERTSGLGEGESIKER